MKISLLTYFWRDQVWSGLDSDLQAGHWCQSVAQITALPELAPGERAREGEGAGERSAGQRRRPDPTGCCI